MESFFALLQKNILDYKNWATYQELRLAIFEWITVDYNQIRKQAKLEKLSPTEYEKIKQAAPAA